MNYALHRPGGLLQGLVACFWYWEGAPQGHAQEQLMPNDEASIIFNLREDPIRIYESQHRDRFQSYGCAVVSGPRTRPFVIDSAQQERVFGIQSRAGGAWPFFQMPASKLANQSVSLHDLWSTSAHQLREQLLLAASPAEIFARAEQHLLSTLIRRGKSHAAVDFALRYFTRNPSPVSIPALADRIGLSHRRFGQLFLRQVELVSQGILPCAALPARSHSRPSTISG